MLAVIYQSEVTVCNLMAALQPRESDVEFEEDETTNTKDDESKLTPDLEDDIFKYDEEIRTVTELI
jgi:hypothetical protein